MKRIGIFVDSSNLYHNIGKKFNRKKLNYQAYLEYVKDLGEVVTANVYGQQVNNRALVFIERLKAMGYVTNFHIDKRLSWDVGITVDIHRNSDLDLIVLGTNSLNFIPLLKCLKVETLVLASNIGDELRACSRCVEIPESLLEKRPQQ